jgi:hypothetical protein
MIVDSGSFEVKTQFSNDIPGRKKLNQVQLRIKNDLLDIKRNRLCTRMFNEEISEIKKDEINKNFKIEVNFILVSPPQLTYKVKLKLLIKI